MNTNDLIPVEFFNGEPTVLGRDLHSALKIKTHYKDWIKRMIAYGFEENIDYVQFYEDSSNLIMIESNRSKKSGIVNSGVNRNFDVKINHKLKLDMAKEIAMIQRSEIGRKIRQYFIEVEKSWRQKTSSFGEIPTSNSPRNLALIDAGQQAIILSQYFGVDLGIARAHSLNVVEKTYELNLDDIKKLLPVFTGITANFNPTQLSEKLNSEIGVKLSAKQINFLLAELNLQNKINGEWILTEEGKQYGSAFPYERNGHSGLQILWNENVINLLKQKLS